MGTGVSVARILGRPVIMLMAILISRWIIDIIEFIVHHLSPSGKNLEIKVKVANCKVTVKAPAPFRPWCAQYYPVIVGVDLVIPVLVYYLYFSRYLLINQSGIGFVGLPDSCFLKIIKSSGGMPNKPAIGNIIGSGGQF